MTNKLKSSNSAVTNKASVRWIMLIYFLSGACSLIDEVIWVRLLKLTLGNTVYAASIVVSIFMGGLALGALIMSRYSDRIKNRLKLYALLEALVTISALAIPLLLTYADKIYVWFFQTYQPSHGQLLVVQVIISASILLIPSMLMGSTLPLLGRFVTSLEKEAGHLVGKLYALNTLGAAAGCLLAGFVMIRSFGVMGTLYIAAMLNILVAFGGWFLSRFAKTTESEQEQKTYEELKPVALKPKKDRFYILVAAFFMSGLISIGYELLWMRSIIHLLGGFTYVFAAVLTVYLLGNVIGAAIASRIAGRVKTPAAAFALTLSLLGLCGIFYMPVLILWTENMPDFLKMTYSTSYSWTNIPPSLIEPVIHSLILFLVPAIIMGLGFPFALQAWANHMHKVGRSTGTAYGANTIGAVAGGIITGFVLIPLLGVQLSISILGIIGLWIAAIMWLAFSSAKTIIKKWSLIGAAILFSIVFIIIPTNLFDAIVNITQFIPKDYKLVAVKEGITTTISVHRDKNNSLHLYSSGQSIAGDTFKERGDQKLLGHLGILLHKDAKSVLSVGFGSGETTACLAMHDLERIDCVEIAPEVMDVALEYFSHINLGENLYDHINMIFMDAKNYLHLTDRKYDIIVNDSIHPRDFAENASLYAKEYFINGKKHLNKNGIMISWIPTYRMPASVYKSIIGTALDTFKHVTLWYPTSHPAPLVLIIGSNQQQYYSPAHIDKILSNPRISENIRQIEMFNSIDTLSCYIGDETDLRRIIDSFSVNSDYYPFIEFNTDLWTSSWDILRLFVLNVRTDTIYKHLDFTGYTPKQQDQWLTDYKKVFDATEYLFKAKSSNNYLERLKYCVLGLAIKPENPALNDEIDEANERLFGIATNMILNEKTEDALILANKALDIYPNSALAWMVRSQVMLNKRDMQKALGYARKAVQLAPDKTDVRFNLGFMLYRAGLYEQAITEYEKMLLLAQKDEKLNIPERLKMLSATAKAYAAISKFEQAASIAEKAFKLARENNYIDEAKEIIQQLSLYRSGILSQ